MLEHIIGVEEASELWGLSTSEIEDLCEQQKIVSKKVGETWIIYKRQDPKWIQTKEDAIELSKTIEWELLSPQERRAILDENTRIFNRKVELLRWMKERGLDESLIRESIPAVSDEEYKNIQEACYERFNL